MQFCTDNGAMIAMAGYLKLCENKNILKDAITYLDIFDEGKRDDA